jgi:hypothetical protein
MLTIPNRPVFRKTSLSVPETLWKRLRIRAIEESRNAQDLLADAIAAYLDAPRKGSPR